MDINLRVTLGVSTMLYDSDHSLCHCSCRCSQGKKAVYKPVTDPEALLLPRPAEATCNQQEGLTPEQLASVFMQSLQQPDSSWPDIVEEVMADCRAAAAWAWRDPTSHNAAEHQPTQAGSQVRQSACRGAAKGNTARLSDSLRCDRPPTATELMTGLHLSQSSEQQPQQQHQGSANLAADPSSTHPTPGQASASALGIFADCDSYQDDDDVALLQAAMAAKVLGAEQHLPLHGFMGIPTAPGINGLDAIQRRKEPHLQDDGELSQEAQHAAPWDCPLPMDAQGHAFQMDQEPQGSDIIFDYGNEAISPAQIHQTDRNETQESHETPVQRSVGSAMQAEADRSDVCTQEIPMTEPSGDEDIVFPDEQPEFSNQISFLGAHPKRNFALLQHATSVAHSIQGTDDPAIWMDTLYSKNVPEEGHLSHHREAWHASQHDSLQQESLDKDAGTASEAAQQFRSDSVQEQGPQPQAALHAMVQHVMADEVLQTKWASERAHDEDIIFDDTTADHSAHWLQTGSPNQIAGDSNACQEVRHSDIASGSAMRRQKRIRKELRDKLIQVHNFTFSSSRCLSLQWLCPFGVQGERASWQPVGSHAQQCTLSMCLFRVM